MEEPFPRRTEESLGSGTESEASLGPAFRGDIRHLQVQAHARAQRKWQWDSAERNLWKVTGQVKKRWEGWRPGSEESRSQRSLDSCEHTVGPEALPSRSLAAAEAASVGVPPSRATTPTGKDHQLSRSHPRCRASDWPSPDHVTRPCCQGQEDRWFLRSFQSRSEPLPPPPRSEPWLGSRCGFPSWAAKAQQTSAAPFEVVWRAFRRKMSTKCLAQLLEHNMSSFRSIAS